MARKIILITGGERSGKSSYAEQLAQELDAHPVYLATARIWDEEFRLRIQAHRQRRGPHWTNIEEPVHLSRHDLTGRTVLVDCLTLWATNLFFMSATSDEGATEKEKADRGQQLVQKVLQDLKEEFCRLIRQEATFIFVTNEIGSGGISPDPVQRQFTDLLGWLNQFVAREADDVYLLVSGIPLKIKAS